MGIRSKYVATVLVLAVTVLAACGPTMSGGSQKTVYVGSELVDCEGAGPQKCMLVKENPEDPWRPFYGQIEGFEYEAGYEYELQITEEQVKDPAADASSIKWTLIKVVSKAEGPSTPSAQALESGTWTLLSYTDSAGKMAELLPDSEITALFQAGEINGNAGCNQYFGSYQAQGSTLTLGPVGMTEMYCMPDELMAQETDYLAALQNAASYEIVDGQLRILDGSSNLVLTFASRQATPLTGTLWQLAGYNDGKGGFVSILADTEILAVFDDKGTVSGSGGCNSYHASYEIDGDQITVSPVASTMMMCAKPEGVMEQDSAYFSALGSASTYGIQGGELTIWNTEGQRVLTYTARQAEPLVGTPWQLVSYSGGQDTVVSVLVGTAITAIFDRDGTVSGSAGCNNYNATYQVGETDEHAAGAISFGPPASTRMMCAEPEGIMQQEADYLAALERADRYQIMGQRLTLMEGEDRFVAEYVVQAAASSLDTDALLNVEYRSEWTQSGTALLVNGEYSEEAAPGSATKTTVTLLPEYTTTGQLSGQEAAAVVLVTDPGGSGTFFDLAIVVDQGGQLANIATTSLGDRVQLNSITIEQNQIVVDMVSHGPDDPMCCPTQRMVESYELQGDQLVQTGSRTIDSTSDAGLEPTDTV